MGKSRGIVDEGAACPADRPAPPHLHYLYEISKLLTRFESAELMLPSVLGYVAKALPARNAILILERGARSRKTLLWSPAQAADPALRTAQARAEKAHAYLCRAGDVADARNDGPPRQSGQRPAEPVAQGGDPRHFLLIPLAVGHAPVFGTLQLECLCRPRESDLLFFNAVANQLAVALDRRSEIDQRQATMAAAKIRAEEERDVAEDMKARYECLVDHLDHAFVWEADPTTLQVLYASAHAEVMLGSAPERWLSGPDFWKMRVHPDDRDKFEHTLRKAAETKTDQRCDHRCMTPDGHIIWLHTGVHLAPSNGRASRLQGISVDVTATKQSEMALLDADRRKNEFLAMLAHELRSPLAPIANAAHLLCLDEADDAARQQAAAIVERQTGRLARLIEDLLDVSRITSGKIPLHLAHISIGDVVQGAIEIVRPWIDTHHHVLTVSVPTEPVWVAADALRLEQVVQNLLTNAVKYTDDGGCVEISVQHEGSEAVLRVTDTGLGIAPDLLPRVFDLFTQAEGSLDRARGGLGIGLALVQRLVTMHNGTIGVRSVVGQGTEFTVRLPTVSAAQPESPREAAQPARSPSLRVLVVDDDIDSARSLAMLLEACGHLVSVAHDGRSALRIAGESHPQAVFLDIGLPDLDGYEVAKRMRRLAGLDDAELVALTGYGHPGDLRRSREAGFDRHLVKPGDFSQMKQILQEVAAGADSPRRRETRRRSSPEESLLS